MLKLLRLFFVSDKNVASRGKTIQKFTFSRKLTNDHDMEKL